MTSFGCHSAFMFPYVFYVYTEALVCYVMLFFCHIKCFSYKTIHEEYFPIPQNDNYLVVHEKPELFSHLPFGTDDFVHKKQVLFLYRCA